MDVEELICRWAERKYDLENVTSVGFDMEPGSEGVGGCDTCGFGAYGAHDPYITVMVYVGHNLRHRDEVEYTTTLIHDILTSTLETD